MRIPFMLRTLSIILSSTLVLLSCNEEERYRVLSFFFDGVPLPESMRPVAEQIDSTRIDSTTKNRVRKPIKPRLQVEATRMYLHKPFREKKCTFCHLGDMGQRLQMERVDELCKSCHEQFKENYTYVHGPVAIGQCLICHNPHSTRYPHLTIRQGEQLCRYCHKNVNRASAPEHYFIGQKVCYECHNPHFSNTSKFFVLSTKAK